MRQGTNGAFQLNVWIPDPEPERNRNNETAVRAFLSQWGPEVPADAADAKLIDFEAQCDAMIDELIGEIAAVHKLDTAEAQIRRAVHLLRQDANALPYAEVADRIASDIKHADVQLESLFEEISHFCIGVKPARGKHHIHQVGTGRDLADKFVDAIQGNPDKGAILGSEL